MSVKIAFNAHHKPNEWESLNLNYADQDQSWKMAWFLFFEQNRLKDAFHWKQWSLRHNLEIESIPKDFNTQIRKVQMLLWLQSYDDAIVQSKKLAEFVTGKKEKTIVAIMEQNIQLFDIYNPKQKIISSTSDIKNLIKDKKILISGPASFDNRAIDQENNIDICIQFNIITAQKKKYPMLIGHYSKENFIKYYDSIINLLQDGYLDFCIVNGLSLKHLTHVDDALKHKFAAPTPFLGGFHSPLLGINRCLIDLISYHAQDIYIENIDLFTNIPYHHNSYPESIKTNKDVLRSWSIHDVLYNFNLTKYFIKSYNVHTTEHLSEICNLDIYQYIDIISTPL